MLFRQLGDELHHHQGADGDDLVVGLALADELLQGVGHQALFPVGAVVGHHDKLVADRPEFLLQDDQVLVPEAHNGVDLRALLVELFRHRVGDGAAHAAADDGHLFQALRLRGAAQGAHKILKAVALLQVVQLFRGGAHDLENNGHGARFPVEVRHSQGDAFALLVHPQDDELPWLSLFGDKGRLNVHPGDGGVEHLFFHNSVHRPKLLCGRKHPPKAAWGIASCILVSIIEEKAVEINRFSHF